MTTSAFQEGFQAYKSGKSKKDNPYEMGSEEFGQWQKGWNVCRARVNDGTEK